MPAQRSGMASVLAKEEYTRKEETHVPGKKLFVVFIALDGFTIYSNLISSRAMPVANWISDCYLSDCQCNNSKECKKILGKDTAQEVLFAWPVGSKMRPQAIAKRTLRQRSKPLWAATRPFIQSSGGQGDTDCLEIILLDEVCRIYRHSLCKQMCNHYTTQLANCHEAKILFNYS